MITEFGMSSTLKNNQRRPIADAVYGVDVGAMKNIDERFAVGGTIHLALAFYDTRESMYGRLAVKPRLRYWLDRDIGLDVSPGLLVQDGSRRTALGFIGQVAVSFGDYGSVTGQIEVYDSPLTEWSQETRSWEDEKKTEVAAHAGIRFGSYAGMAAGALPLLVTLISGITQAF